jgi:hypothetical protein
VYRNSNWNPNWVCYQCCFITMCCSSRIHRMILCESVFPLMRALFRLLPVFFFFFFKEIKVLDFTKINLCSRCFSLLFLNICMVCYTDHSPNDQSPTTNLWTTNLRTTILRTTYQKVSKCGVFFLNFIWVYDISLFHCEWNKVDWALFDFIIYVELEASVASYYGSGSLILSNKRII